MIVKLLLYFLLATCLGSNGRSMTHHITKPIITRGCHYVLSGSYSILRKDSLEDNNVTNCYQFCFLNQSGSTVKVLLMKGTECVCSVETLYTSFYTAKRCTESCPGNPDQSCGGSGNHTYAVYEIENITLNDQEAGCGLVKFQLHETDQNLSSDDCNKNKMAYCTMLNNVDGTVIKTANLTWDEHNKKCPGHLAVIKDTKTVEWKSENTSYRPSFTFWVGHRIWRYVPSELDTADSSNDHDDTESVVTKDEINESSGGTADSSNDLDDTESVVPKDEIKKSSDAVPSTLTFIIAVTVPVVVLIVILLAVVYIKRKKSKLNSSNQHKNASSKNAADDHYVPLQPIRGQSEQDQDYNHLHGDTAPLHSDNVYDVSGQCTDGPGIQDSVYNTSKQCSGNELYDSSVRNPQKSESENIMNSDMYSTVNRQGGGEFPKDMDLYDHTNSSAQNDKTDIYNDIDT